MGDYLEYMTVCICALCVWPVASQKSPSNIPAVVMGLQKIAGNPINNQVYLINDINE